MKGLFDEISHLCLDPTGKSGFPGGSVVKNLPANAGDQGSTLGQVDLLEKGMATHSSMLAWRIRMDRGAWWAPVHRVAKIQT